MSEKESPHIIALRKQDKLNRLAKKKPAQDIEAVVKTAAAAEKRRRAEADAELIATARPGQLIEGHGIFLGAWTPNDRDGNSLRLTFNVFAAPEDLPAPMTYENTVKYVAQLKDWNGYGGTHYANDGELHEALRKGDYRGGWIIPPRDVLCGVDVNDKFTMRDNLLAHKDKCGLKNIFKSILEADLEKPGWYWSSTEISKSTEIRNASDKVYDLRLPVGNWFWSNKNINRLSCRPVRLEPRP